MPELVAPAAHDVGADRDDHISAVGETGDLRLRGDRRAFADGHRDDEVRVLRLGDGNVKPALRG